MTSEASHLLETVTAFEKALDGSSGDAELEASVAMKTAAISFLRKVSERDAQLAELVDEFDEREDAVWNDNSIQFARLLSEVHVVITDDMVQMIAASMGISLNRVRHLFQRADDAYTNYEIFGKENRD